MSRQVTVLNEPKLNLPGQGQPEIYGHSRLAERRGHSRAVAREANPEPRRAITEWPSELLAFDQDAVAIGAADIFSRMRGGHQTRVGRSGLANEVAG